MDEDNLAIYSNTDELRITKSVTLVDDTLFTPLLTRQCTKDVGNIASLQFETEFQSGVSQGKICALVRFDPIKTAFINIEQKGTIV